MSDNLVIIPTLEQLVLHELAKKLWNDFVLKNSWYMYASVDSNHLVSHRKKIIKAIPRLFPISFPNLLKDKLIGAVINLYLGYDEAWIWESRHSYILPFSMWSSEVGKYEAGSFIDPFEHFDDFSYAKMLVADENQPLFSRFILACEYCFVDMISILWQEMKAKNCLPCEGDLSQIQDKFGEYIGLWIYHLEEKIEEARAFESNFYIDAFNEAVFDRYEYAVRFFWRHCSNDEKSQFLLNFSLDNFDDGMPYVQTRVIYFIYSLLPPEQKNKQISWTSDNQKGVKIWSALLCSYFRNSILDDILTLSGDVHSKFFEHVLSRLVCDISESPIPANKEVFKIMWNHLSQSQQNKILKSSDIFSNLVDINDIDLFEAVILPLYHSMKDELLLNNWQYGGQYMIESLFEKGNYDKLLQYLVFFFLNYNPANQKLTLRVDPVNLLDSFMSCSLNLFWINEDLPPSEAQKVNQIIKHFRESLPIIDQLVNQVEAERTGYVINYHDFLSNNIYPLLSVKGKIINDKINCSCCGAQMKESS